MLRFFRLGGIELFFAIFGFLVFVTPPVQSKPIGNGTQYYGWYVNAYTSDDTGQFSHCSASVPYRSGTTLVFALGTGGWTLALLNPNWKMAVGSKFPVRIQIDRNQPIVLTATALMPTMAGAPLELSNYLFQLFKRGRLLRVQGAGESLGFDLTNSSKVLDLTLACADKYLNAPANPFGAPSSAAVSPPPSERAELIAYVATTLSQAGIQGVTISPDKPTGSFSTWDVSWAGQSVVGVAKIDLLSLEAVASGLVSSDSKDCAGSFASTREKKGDVLILRTACQIASSGAMIHILYTIVPRATGGSYVMGTFESAVGSESPPASNAPPSNTLLNSSSRLSPVDPR